MCSTCGWLSVVVAIEAHLERRVIDHAGVILGTLADVIEANRHVTPEQRDAAEAEIERHEGALS